MFAEFYFELKYFKSHVIMWKKQYILQQTLYQIELQKNVKLRQQTHERVDEDFNEEEVLA